MLLIHIIPTLGRPGIAGDCDHARIAASQLARGGKRGRLSRGARSLQLGVQSAPSRSGAPWAFVLAARLPGLQ